MITWICGPEIPISQTTEHHGRKHSLKPDTQLWIWPCYLLAMGPCATQAFCGLVSSSAVEGNSDTWCLGLVGGLNALICLKCLQQGLASEMQCLCYINSTNSRPTPCLRFALNMSPSSLGPHLASLHLPCSPECLAPAVEPAVQSSPVPCG